MLPNRLVAAGGPGAALRHCAQLAPGLFVAGLIAWSARYLAGITPLPAVLIALMLGALCAGALRGDLVQPGIATGGRHLLRFGVALLGAQVTFAELQQLGLPVLLTAMGAVLVTLLIGYPAARLMGLRGGAALLTAGGVAICGASAVVAIAAFLPKAAANDEDAGATVAAVTIVGTAAMLLYPVLAALLGFGPVMTGVFLGGALHEVVQVVGAGFGVSDTVGEMATAVKLVRVACLAPVVLCIGWALRRRDAHATQAGAAIVPSFLIGFIALSALASLGTWPPALLLVLAEASRWCLLIGVAALGAALSLTHLVSRGLRVMIVVGVQSAVIAAFLILAASWLPAY